MIYYLRRDPLIQNSNIKFSNFRIFESGTQDPYEKEVYNGGLMEHYHNQQKKDIHSQGGTHKQMVELR